MGQRPLQPPHLRGHTHICVCVCVCIHIYIYGKYIFGKKNIYGKIYIYIYGKNKHMKTCSHMLSGNAN